MFLLTSVMMLVIVRKGNGGQGAGVEHIFLLLKVEDCVVKQ